ncbi:uncharacterized protein LOC112456011 [Temnothorax curvispinosus]|uniref:Uncharacterized protein LOC112456011 n=1 Tax=Temnothorax curvispinosus TaxID=300111 RepID=A0A6J1PZ78_9HYME|nr:uncharacterized protein LOC112456011 [Temnothorax curvispinosus]
MEKNQEINKNFSGPHAQEAAITASAEMKRTQALERLEKLTSELHEFVKSKVNIHKEIKTKTTSVVNALQRFKTLDEEWQSSRRLTPRVTPEKSSQPTAETEEAMDTGVDGDNEFVAGDKNETGTKSNKRKYRTSPDPTVSQVTKRKNLKRSPLQRATVQSGEHEKTTAWQIVQSKKELKKQRKEQLPKQPPTGPRPEPKRKKPRKWIRPDALIIRPAQKEKYADILRRIKTDVHDDQARLSVEKILKTKNGDMLITLSKKSTDKGQALQKAIAGILKEDAEVICKGPQEVIEIRDVDDTTTKEDIQTALRKETGGNCEIPLEAIKIRKAYRGTQTATVTLPAVVAQTLLGRNGKIRIGWVNCRIRATKRPIQCFKCWIFGHFDSQCKSEVNRSNLCIRCGQEGHKIADCKNPAKCVLCIERHGAEKAAHHAGTHRCPAFQEALQKITNTRT